MKPKYITDVHLSDRNPASWKVNYRDTTFAKFEWVLARCKQDDSPLLMSGDFFDYWDQSAIVVNEVIRLVRLYGVKVVTCLGQHDVNGHNSASYVKTWMGVLHSAGVIHVLNNGDSLDLGEVVVRGYSFNDPETRIFLRGEDEVPDDDRFHIALVHASVAEYDGVAWQSIAKQNIKSADLSLFGDIHVDPWTHTFSNGCVAVGVGTFGRRSKSDRGKPSIMLSIDIDEGGATWTPEIVPEQDDADIYVDEAKDEPEKREASERVAQELNKIGTAVDESSVARVKRVGKAGEFDDEIIGLLAGRVKE